MTHQLICSWLGLSDDEAWPPDHYRLLGLRPGEDREDLIEERIHSCLDKVRAYQLTYPEQATEAMNRLAQAFVCLTEPKAKQVYDEALLGGNTIAVEVEPDQEPEPLYDTPDPLDPLAWLYNPASLGQLGPPPPPVRTHAVPPPLPPIRRVVAALQTEETETLVPGAWEETAPDVPPLPEPPPEPSKPPDLAEEAARCRRACRGLRSKRALYRRIARTRELLRLWTEVGTSLANPQRRITRTAELTRLDHRLADIVDALEDFPPVLGRAGQPGYLVVTLEEMQLKPTFQKLTQAQREALSRDWQAGLNLLNAHKQFLREEVRKLKRCQRLHPLRALALLIRRPRVTLMILLALLALNVAIWRIYGPAWWHLLRSWW
jgi:hypothetical protein